jgi:hypothetical protein
MKTNIIHAALTPNGLELTPDAAIKVARHFRDDDHYALAATRLAMAWGGLTQDAAKAEGFRFIGSVTDDLADDPADVLEIAAAFWQQHVPAPTGPVHPEQILWGDGDFAANRALAAEIGPHIRVCTAPGGYLALIQTDQGICEPGSAMARTADPKGWLQNAARNITALCRMTLGRLLTEDGIDLEAFLELQEDALCAEAARQGIGIDAITGKYPWE